MAESISVQQQGSMFQAGSLAAKYLQRKERFDAVNAQKIEQALAVMSADARRMLQLLPVFLHYNEKEFPGYRTDGVPCGIDGFELTPEQEAYVRDVTGHLPAGPKPSECCILALYGMGSTASIGQGCRSDFDIWVCVPHTLGDDEITALTEKCTFVCSFAKCMGVDLNLFVTKDDRFTMPPDEQVGGDNCGSAQNLFLLDEFYRSAVRLCGRYLAWFFISNLEEIEDYEGYLTEFAHSGVLSPREYFDFGSVVNSSPAEYFGSGLWLLYKGIEYPFKAVLKILLMEVYADEYPQSVLLSSQMKDKLIFGSGKYDLELDPYYVMYKKVHDYLLRQGDIKRLQMVRKCFYLKIFLGLRGLTADSSVIKFRRRFLDDLAEIWRWSTEEKETLENRALWKIHYVREFYAELFAALIKSYRALLSFSVRHGIEYAITSDDAGVLSRKLYTAYDKYQNKVVVYSSEFRYSLEEKNLTFIKAGKDSICRSGWHLYAAPLDGVEILNSRSVYVGSQLAEVVTWACFNQLLTRSTDIDCAGSLEAVTAEKIKRLADDIMNVLAPAAMDKVSDSALLRPRDIKACAVILNLERDATLENRLTSADVLNVGSTLCAGRQRICLIGSISLITINSWGETIALELPDGEQGVVELLATLLRIAKSTDGSSKDLGRLIHVFSYSAREQESLCYDLQAVIRQAFACVANDRDEEFIFEVGHNTYAARRVQDRGVYIVRHNMLSAEDNSFGVHTRYGMRPEYSLQVPPLVDRYSNIGIMQYFFAPVEDGWDIYIVNENNEVKTYYHYVGSRAALVNAINRYYTKQSEENRAETTHFNLPQYFVLSADRKSIHPFTIREQARVD
ncbi:MAG: class I adenylate cyclase [Proteobacteria bacterium]|uniref:Class I adenylate cyclase n=1 Tax=Candidatus Avisuccinivibrio stercorigallinarum TaxID=2840704 RepID=A0A9D9D8Q4_9GAMM|nr:class I adenylate cyclase [Candidatus Avisuccinivibrio stercorigallinarum]